MLKHMPSGSAGGHQHQHQHHSQHQHPPPPNQSQQQQQHTPQNQEQTRSQQQAQESRQQEPRPQQPQLPPPRPSRVLNRSIQPLNVSTISHHLNTTSGTNATNPTPNKLIPNGHANGGLRIPHQTPATILNTTPLTSCSSMQTQCNLHLSAKHRVGAREALTSLGLLCLGEWVAFG